MEVMEGLVLDKQFGIEFVIQLALFLSSFAVMKILVFKPLIELFHIREHKTHGFKEEAEQTKHKVAKLKEDYGAFIKAEHKKNSTWLEEEKKKITDEEQKIVQSARDEASKRLEDLRRQIGTDTTKARTELTPMISDFASRIASKLIGKAVNITGDKVDLKKNKAERPVVQG